MPFLFFPEQKLKAQADAGDSLVEAVYRFDLPVRFKCERAICTTCLIEVLEGLENLSPPTDREKAALAKIGAPSHWRLACQVRLFGDITLIPLPPGDARRAGVCPQS